ncbi:MAG: hypothetical protein IPH72_07855 [Sandaracinaceae bacterium]|nr:hypothetical protein [Sandaracinaceae bacterium]
MAEQMRAAHDPFAAERDALVAADVAYPPLGGVAVSAWMTLGVRGGSACTPTPPTSWRGTREPGG